MAIIQPLLSKVPGVAAVVNAAAIADVQARKDHYEDLLRPHQCTTIHAMPRDLSLRLRRYAGAFPEFRVAVERWEDWLKTHQPTLEQAYRKLLVDFWFDYRAANRLGSGFRTELGPDYDGSKPEYKEFNRLTGSPITSTNDYIQRVGKLVLYLLSEDHDDNGEAMIRFIVTGDPRPVASAEWLLPT